MAADRVELSQDMLLAALGDGWSPADVNAAAELLSGGEGQFPSGIRSLPSGPGQRGPARAPAGGDAAGDR